MIGKSNQAMLQDSATNWRYNEPAKLSRALSLWGRTGQRPSFLKFGEPPKKLLRTWSRGNQWFVPPACAGRDELLWDLAYYDELDNGAWDVEIHAEENRRLSSVSWRRA